MIIRNYSRKYWVFYALFVMGIFMAGCSLFTKHGKLTKLATEAFQKSDYDAAVKYATQALRIKPEYEDAQKVLVNSFPISIRDREKTIAGLGERTDLDSIELRVNEYKILIDISNSVKNLPPLLDDDTKQTITFNFKNYSESFTQSKQVAAEAFYKSGVKLGAAGGINNSKSAAKAFKKSQYYIPQYKDTVALYEKFRLAGIKRIAILSFINKSGQNQYGAIGELVSDQITSTIMGTPEAMEFLNIISRSELEQSLQSNQISFSGTLNDSQVAKIGESLGLDEIIVGQITQINTSSPQQTVKEVNEKRNVIVGEEDYINKKGEKASRSVYGNVHARVKVTRMNANAKITGSYKIINVKTAQLIKTGSFSEAYDYNHKWASYTGDERALSSRSNVMIKNEPGIAPSNGDRVNLAAKQLVSSMSNKIIAYTK